MNCTPNSLANAARCFKSCVAQGEVQAIKSLILCSMWNNGGVGGRNLIPANSTYSGGGTYTLNVLANTTYDITWGANDTSVNICGTVYNTKGAGGITTVYTSSCTTMVFTGTGGSTVTAKVVQQPKKAPVTTGFAITLGTSGTTVTASWNTPPSQVASTEVWTSTDNLNFTLAATVAAPGTTNSIAVPAAGSYRFVEVRWITTGGLIGEFTNSQGASGQVLNWATRVITNGGAALSASTMAAMNTFDVSLQANGLTARCQYILTFPSDGLVAARTPLYKVTGNDPATNNNFVAGDLTINGLVGDGASKWLNSGVLCTDWAVNSTKGGLACYTSTSDQSSNQIDIGNSNGPFSQGMDIRNNTTPGQCQSNFPPSGAAQSTIAVNANNFAGFCLMTRSSGVDHRLYNGNSTTPFSQIGSNATDTSAVNMQGTPLGLFCEYQSGITPAFFTKKRVSFMGIFNGGFSTGEGQALFNAVQAMRVSMGGGFV